MRRPGVIVGIALILSSSCALAQGVGPSGPERTALRNFNSIDIDGDGAITRRDASQAWRLAEGLHQILDRDNDGVIWRDEFVTSPSRARWWPALDADHDGRVTVEELRQRVSPDLIGALDLNGDGRLTLRELRYQR